MQKGRVNKARLESFVIEQLKAHLLTGENLAAMVRLVNNEEIDRSENRLAVIDRQLEDLRGRLHKLYLALETGKLGVEDLAPRIKELRGQIDDLEEKRLDLVESLQDARVELLESSRVREYADDLRALLSQGSIAEQKSVVPALLRPAGRG